jgi:hypothetical protein
MTIIPLLISAISLVLSITVAWLTLLRRGTLGMTQPMLVGFLHEAEEPKIFLRAMLYATGKRGHIVEALYLRYGWVNRRRRLTSGCTAKRTN